MVNQRIPKEPVSAATPKIPEELGTASEPLFQSIRTRGPSLFKPHIPHLPAQFKQDTSAKALPGNRHFVSALDFSMRKPWIVPILWCAKESFVL